MGVPRGARGVRTIGKVFHMLARAGCFFVGRLQATVGTTAGDSRNDGGPAEAGPVIES